MYTLVENGLENSIPSLIYPGFLIVFGPSLFGNLIYKDMEISRTSLISYFIGIMIFTAFSNIRIIRHLASILSITSKGFKYIGLKNNQQPFHLLVAWLIGLDCSSILLQKIIFNKSRMNVTNDKLGETFFLISGLGLGRLYRLPDYTMIVMVLLVSINPLVQHIVSSVISNQKKEKYKKVQEREQKKGLSRKKEVRKTS
jgi:hypothetical protein